MRQHGFGLIAFVFLLVACGTDEELFAGNSNAPAVPHPHQGKLQNYDGAPYHGVPPQIDLNDEERAYVASGKPLYKNFPYDGGARAVAVFRVNAPKDKVADVIGNFDQYPNWIGKCKQTKVYKKDGERVYVGFKVGSWGMTWTYYINHNWPLKTKGYATWKLDYSRKSEIDDSVGFWRINAVNSQQTDVTYSIDVLPGGLGDWVKDMLIKDGIKEATTWVKEQSES